jgi:hypothetical protein
MLQDGFQLLQTTATWRRSKLISRSSFLATPDEHGHRRSAGSCRRAAKWQKWVLSHGDGQLTLSARSHLTFWGPVDMTVEQISEEVRRDNEFYDRWFTEWDAYFSESIIVTSIVSDCRSDRCTARQLHS